MNSMTGFGRGAADHAGGTVAAEIRSVNGRHLEVKSRLPRALSGRESDVERIVRGRVERGTLTVNVTVEAGAAGDAPLRVDAARTRGYAALLRELAAAAGVDEPIRLDHVLRFADVFTAEAATGGDDGLWEATRTAFERALIDLDAMRAQEGGALADDLTARLNALASMLSRVEARAPERAAEARERLRARVDEILGEGRVPAERIEQEITLLADRLDVTEECVRLRAHVQFFADAMAAPEPPGRRLGFLAQEMGREVNTIGSKANDAALQHLAVAMKEELEKIREQVANVE